MLFTLEKICGYLRYGRVCRRVSANGDGVGSSRSDQRPARTVPFWREMYSVMLNFVRSECRILDRTVTSSEPIKSNALDPFTVVGKAAAAATILSPVINEKHSVCLKTTFDSYRSTTNS